jgi:hypothetical protein
VKSSAGVRNVKTMYWSAAGLTAIFMAFYRVSHSTASS